jgi:hypothetical protein
VAVVSVSAAQYSVGKIINLRGRDWVVVGKDGEDFLQLKPLSGTEEEAAAIHLGLEGDISLMLNFPHLILRRAATYFPGDY